MPNRGANRITTHYETKTWIRTSRSAVRSPSPVVCRCEGADLVARHAHELRSSLEPTASPAVFSHNSSECTTPSATRQTRRNPIGETNSIRPTVRTEVRPMTFRRIPAGALPYCRRWSIGPLPRDTASVLTNPHRTPPDVRSERLMRNFRHPAGRWAGAQQVRPCSAPTDAPRYPEPPAMVLHPCHRRTYRVSPRELPQTAVGRGAERAR